VAPMGRPGGVSIWQESGLRRAFCAVAFVMNLIQKISLSSTLTRHRVS
jgi:hypothetical protein